MQPRHVFDIFEFYILDRVAANNTRVVDQAGDFKFFCQLGDSAFCRVDIWQIDLDVGEAFMLRF